MIRNKNNYNDVIRLRKEAKSYKQISRILSVPKSTISDWLSNKRWSDTIKLQLVDENRRKSANFFRKIGRLKHKSTIEKYAFYRESARKEYESLKQNRLFLTGLSIYWGEGEKTEAGRVSIVNSDSNMLRVMIKFFRRALKIPEEKLRAALFVYSDINERSALDFWSSLLRIDRKQFIKTQILPSRSSLTHRKVINGMCNIYFTSKEMSIKMQEWIRLLSLEMRV